MYHPSTATIQRVPIERVAEPGETLFYEGESCECVFELRSGIARGVNLSADGERQISAFFFEGDQIGLPLSDSYRFSAEAVTQLRYVRHARSSWHEAFCRNSREQGRLLPTICAEQDPFFRRGIIIGRHGLLVRLCAFLISIADRLPRERGLIMLPLTQADIGAYLATAPESVCRGLRQLREMGVIAMPRRERLQILDRSRLEAIASGAEG